MWAWRGTDRLSAGAGARALQFFGTYLQLGVWISVLSFAGYKGITLAQSNPQDVGLLVAPPAAAAFLIVTFLASKRIGKY